MPDAPETIDLSADGGIWPAFTVSGTTGATGVNAERFLLAAEGGQRTWRTAEGAECYGAPDDVWVLAASDANAPEPAPPGGSFTGEGTWPWMVGTWTPADGAGGAPVFARALAPPAGVVMAGAAAAVQATLTAAFSGLNNDLLFEAIPSGRLGNDIAVTITANGSNAVLSISVIGREIVINLGTGTNAGTTANQVIAAIGANAAAAALVTVDNAAGNDGTGTPTVRARATLSGGTGGLPLPPETVAI